MFRPLDYISKSKQESQQVRPSWQRLDLSRGLYEDLSVVHKFGANTSVGTTLAPVCTNGIYRTPQGSGATALRIKAGGNANDTAAGSGAREVVIQGLDETGVLAEESIATSGASASAATTTTFLRVFRAYVSASGTYASQSAGSHSAAITIENASGGDDWALIGLGAGFPQAQTEIGAYTIPLGYKGYVFPANINVNSNKDTDILFFQRQGVLDESAPYEAMRVVFKLGALATGKDYPIQTPLEFPELTDIGFMAKVDSTTAEVDVDFEIVLLKES